VECGGVDWTELARDTFSVGFSENDNVFPVSTKERHF
jgi:hypothetical protein